MPIPGGSVPLPPGPVRGGRLRVHLVDGLVLINCMLEFVYLDFYLYRVLFDNAPPTVAGGGLCIYIS